MTEWVEEINNWPEDIYRQYNLTVLFDMEKDQKFVERNPQIGIGSSDSTVAQVSINKKVVLYGVSFPTFGESNPAVIKNLHFKKDFIVYNLSNDRLFLKGMTFDQLCQLRLLEVSFVLVIGESQFNGPFMFNNPKNNMALNIIDSQFERGFYFTSSNTGIPNLRMIGTKVKGITAIGNISTLNSLFIERSTFEELNLEGKINTNAVIVDSEMNTIQFEGLSLPERNTYISFDQIGNKLKVIGEGLNPGEYYTTNSPQSHKNKQIYDRLNSQYTMLKGTYTARGDMHSYNACYVEMKDFETKRLEYLYQQSPTFDAFFTFKINQFLRVFSDYGTRPSKAIIFSVYVILAFALIYLFFPNHWDSHGKDRILHRYQFFFKYLNKDAGMHDVYLDGKKDELAHYDGFKNFFIENGKTVPKFFLATALPIYRWSTASTRSSSWFLQKIDIFKGKWTDLPGPQRAAKTVLLTLAFAFALLYDLFIKMLNALMLSINTFTTLGFGEIPIKGLPRYLAIIQGFIGWFMLTIFSVSLISQLLN